MFERGEGGGAATLAPARSAFESLLIETAPGADLGYLLDKVDRHELDGNDRVALMQARGRLIAHSQAELMADMLSVREAVVEVMGTNEPDFEADEIRAALCLTRNAAEESLLLASLLIERFPNLWQALRDGLLDLPRVRVVAEGLIGLGGDQAAQAIELLLPFAPALTTGQLRARVAKLAISIDPDSARKSYEEGVKSRRVWAGRNPDGTAGLFGLDLPADRVAEAMRRIHQLARELKTADDERSADQVRADVFLDLLTGQVNSSGTGSGVLDLRVDLTTLAGLNENPGEIPGWGPVIADVARQVAERQSKATWQVTVTGQEGEVVWTGTTRRRPTAAMRRYVEVTRPVCVFPGCRMPARQSDIDHNQRWADGGPTVPWNLEPGCRHDHRLKDEGGWKLERIGPFAWRWTSPLGRRYEVGPDPP